MGRDYSCPECGPFVPESRVAILEAGSAFDMRYEDSPGFIDHAQRSLLHSLAAHLRDHVSFVVGENTDGLRREMVATLGVVAKGNVASIEERAKSIGATMCIRMAEESIRLIRLWGSASRYFSHTIHHDDADRIIRAALTKVLSESKADRRGHHDDVDRKESATD